ncbi:MAG: hypothetical protein E3J23_04715 [Candidatus Stahlbacteria bacterium]|nr:MAG: hypothetical protein E3J23_04715 [Candidatus Stahlbacteria bacterium]
MNPNTIKITNSQSGKISVTLPYNLTFIKRIKNIKGYYWNSEQKCLIFPHSDKVIRKLFDIFKDKNIWLDLLASEYKISGFYFCTEGTFKN